MRVNCLDSLDRTNKVQSKLGWWSLPLQAAAAGCPPAELAGLGLATEFDQQHSADDAAASAGAPAGGAGGGESTGVETAAAVFSRLWRSVPPELEVRAPAHAKTTRVVC